MKKNKLLRTIAILLVVISVMSVTALAATWSKSSMYCDTNYYVFTGTTVTKSGVSVSNLYAYYSDITYDDYVITFYLYSTAGSDMWGSKNVTSYHKTSSGSYTGGSGTVGSSGAGSAYLIALNNSPDTLKVSFSYSY